MGRVRPREKASVQDGRDDNDDAGDAQAKQGKPAFGSSEEAAVVKVDKKRAVDAQARLTRRGRPVLGASTKRWRNPNWSSPSPRV